MQHAANTFGGLLVDRKFGTVKVVEDNGHFTTFNFGGGGTSGLQSGIQQQIAGTIASNSENQLSSQLEQNAITSAEQGRENFWKATAGENALGNEQNPEAFGQEAAAANKDAFGLASTINSEKGTLLGDIGKVAGVVGDFFTGGASGAIGAGISALGLGGKTGPQNAKQSNEASRDFGLYGQGPSD